MSPYTAGASAPSPGAAAADLSEIVGPLVAATTLGSAHLTAGSHT
jgi:hypothetical protein